MSSGCEGDGCWEASVKGVKREGHPTHAGPSGEEGPSVGVSYHPHSHVLLYMSAVSSTALTSWLYKACTYNALRPPAL